MPETLNFMHIPIIYNENSANQKKPIFMIVVSIQISVCGTQVVDSYSTRKFLV